MKQIVVVMAAAIASLACGGSGCVQVQILERTAYYSVSCPTKEMTDQCTVGPRVGMVGPQDGANHDGIFMSTGEWHLNSTNDTGPALSGTQDDIEMNGNHYVVDANSNVKLVLTNTTCS